MWFFKSLHCRGACVTLSVQIHPITPGKVPVASMWMSKTQIHFTAEEIHHVDVRALYLPASTLEHLQKKKKKGRDDLVSYELGGKRKHGWVRITDRPNVLPWQCSRWQKKKWLYSSCPWLHKRIIRPQPPRRSTVCLSSNMPLLWCLLLPR